MLQYNAQSINKPHNFAQKLREIEHFLWAWLTKRPIQQISKDISSVCTANVFIVNYTYISFSSMNQLIKFLCFLPLFCKVRFNDFFFEKMQIVMSFKPSFSLNIYCTKAHSLCKQCLHDLHFLKKVSFPPNLSKLARADIMLTS